MRSTGQTTEPHCHLYFPPVCQRLCLGLLLSQNISCQPASSPSLDSRVLIVVLDGIPGSHDIDLPGVRVSQARNLGVPITVEAHTALLTGRRHPMGTFSPGQLGAWRSPTPTLYEAVAVSRDLDPGRQLLAMGNTVLLGELPGSRGPHFAGHSPPMEVRHAPDLQVLAAARARLAADDIHFGLINLHEMDLLAHQGEDYIDPLDALTAPLQSLWSWLEETPPYAGRTHLLLLSDHGRHDWAEPDAWWGHGDQCAGCRELLLHWASPEALQFPDGLLDLTDISASIAALMDVSLPLSRGTPFPGLGLPPLLEPVPGVRFHGGQLWEADAPLSAEAIRSEGAAWAPGAPEPLLCWRALSTDAAGSQVWQPRCAVRGASAAAWPLPQETVSPFWQPALHHDGAVLWLADHTNTNEYTGPSGVRPRLTRGTPASGWSTTTGPEVVYPQGIAMVVRDASTAWLAAAHSAAESEGRDTRQVTVWSVTWPGQGAASWEDLATLPPPDGSVRISSPALHGDWLAALSWPQEGGIEVSVADLPGAIWRTPVSGGLVLGHIAPRWDAWGGLWWVSQPQPDQIALCRWDGVTTDCQPLAAHAADGLSLDDTHVSLNLWDGESWSLHQDSLPR